MYFITFFFLNSGSSSLSTSIQTSNNLLNPLDDIDLLNPMSSQDLQDNGGRLQIDYRFVNGGNKTNNFEDFFVLYIYIY